MQSDFCRVLLKQRQMPSLSGGMADSFLFTCEYEYPYELDT
jgi:hypothetical protein